MAATTTTTPSKDGTRIVFRGKYLSVMPFRRDGSPVATPVWFVQDGERLLFETDSTSHKVGRILHNPTVLVGPCTASGRTRGEPVTASAEILGPEALKRSVR